MLVTLAQWYQYRHLDARYTGMFYIISGLKRQYRANVDETGHGNTAYFNC